MVNFISLEVENFKVFKNATFEWKQITTISGLNGTGKSSIIEAIEFLFCFPKFNRLQVEEFKANLCSVAADKDCARTCLTATFILKNKRVIFKRSVEYQPPAFKCWINNEPLAFKDYKQKLLEYGLHEKLNFIIHQNEVEDIATQDERQRRLFFENLSGSIEYKREYDRLSKQWNEESAKVVGLKKVRDSCEAKAKKIEQMSKEVVKYEGLAEEFKNIKLKISFINLWKIEKTITELQKKRQDEELQLKVTTEKFLNPAEQKITKLKNQLEERGNHLAAVYEQANAAESRTSEQSLKLLKLEEVIAICQDEMKKAEKNFQSAKNVSELHQRIVGDLRDDYRRIKEERDKYVQAQSQILQDSPLQDSQFEEYLSLKARAEEQCMEVTSQLIPIERQRDTLREQIDVYERKMESLVKKIDNEKSLIENMSLDKQRMEEKIKETEKALREVSDTKTRLRNEIENSRIEADKLNAEIQQLNHEISASKAEKTDERKLRRQREILHELQLQFGRAVYGRLIDLCEANKQVYELALTKILGSKMDFIIVDTQETAQRCIMFLKEHYAKDNQSAVATFMPLDAMKKNSTDSISRYVKNLPYAKLAPEVISAGLPEIQSLLQYFIGDIVVCNTDEQASKLSHQKRCKCVSLDGVFYGRDGTISGGLASLLEKAKKWDEKKVFMMEEAKMEKVDNFRKINSAISKKEEDIKNLNIKELGLSGRLQKHLQPLINRMIGQIEEKREVLSNLETELANHQSKEKEMKKLHKKLKNKMDEINQLEQKRREIEHEVFFDFCKTLGIADIRQFEQSDFKDYKQFVDEKNEFNNLLDRIKNQLKFEESRDTKTTVEKWEARLNETKEEYLELMEKKKNFEAKLAGKIEIRNEKKALEQEMENIRKEIILKERESIAIRRDVKDLKKSIAAGEATVTKLRADMHRILKECKMKSIDIPLKKGTLKKVIVNTNMETDDGDYEQTGESSSTPKSNQSNQQSDISSIEEEDVRIDYSKLPPKIRKLPEDDIESLLQKETDQLKQLKEKMELIDVSGKSTKCQSELIKEKKKKAEKDYMDKVNLCSKIKRELEEARKKRNNTLNRFLQGVEKNLDGIFKKLYGSRTAEAHVHFTNPEDPFTSDIVFSCLLPGKSFRPMASLSGGEKTMSALALFIAIQKVKPAPCIIFDEVDAALDPYNLKKITQLFWSLQSEMQIILITHREVLSECSNAFVGINKLPGNPKTSYPLHIDLDKYLKIYDDEGRRIREQGDYDGRIQAVIARALADKRLKDFDH